MNNIPQYIFDSIKKYCLKNPKEETCGIVYLENDDLFFLGCENICIDKKYNFQIDPEVIISYDVKYIVHSHTDCSASPSIADKKSSNELAIPYIIYSIMYDKFEIYQNKSV